MPKISDKLDPVWAMHDRLESENALHLESVSVADKQSMTSMAEEACVIMSLHDFRDALFGTPQDPQGETAESRLLNLVGEWVAAVERRAAQLDSKTGQSMSANVREYQESYLATLRTHLQQLRDVCLF